MTDITAIVVIATVLTLSILVVIMSKMRRVDSVKGMFRTPLASADFEANKSKTNSHVADISDLNARNVVIGDIVAKGEQSLVSLKNVNAVEDINIGDVISEEKPNDGDV